MPLDVQRLHVAIAGRRGGRVEIAIVRPSPSVIVTCGNSGLASERGRRVPGVLGVHADRGPHVPRRHRTEIVVAGFAVGRRRVELRGDAAHDVLRAPRRARRRRTPRGCRARARCRPSRSGCLRLVLSCVKKRSSFATALASPPIAVEEAAADPAARSTCTGSSCPPPSRPGRCPAAGALERGTGREACRRRGAAER